MKWNSIETFFLDMDGTILDLSYDNYFWHQHIPNIYAQKNDISLEKAKLEFEEKYKKKKNTIQWYSLNFWSHELGINLDDELIKTKHKIKIFPGVLKFLDQLKKRRIKIILLTNCPRKCSMSSSHKQNYGAIFLILFLLKILAMLKKAMNFGIFLKQK